MSSTDLPLGPPVASHVEFGEVVAWLPGMLEILLGGEVYNLDRRPPRDKRGIYLFSEGSSHLYVGRTGITARARSGLTTSGTSFRARFDNHTQPATNPGTAPFANRLLRERAGELGVTIPASWWKTRKQETSQIFDLDKQAKLRIGSMDCRVVPFDDDGSGVRSTIAEVYVHVCLGTTYNEFLTS